MARVNQINYIKAYFLASLVIVPKSRINNTSNGFRQLSKWSFNVILVNQITKKNIVVLHFFINNFISFYLIVL